MRADHSLSWFHQKKVFLFDLDGTLYLGKRVLPGARELIAQLIDQKKQIYFFTNNSSRSENDYFKKLKLMGFQVRPGQIIMSTHTLISFLKSKRWSKVFLLGTPAMKKMLQQSKIRHEVKRPNAVVVGFDKTLTYEKLEIACRMVASGIPYIVTHPDYFCPTDIGPEPDCGAFAKVIELATKNSPLVVLGKPHPSMIREAQRRSGAKARDMVLIGDRLMTDMAMGKAAGIDTLMVLTGESQIKDLRGSKVRPRAVVKSVKLLVSGR